MHRKGRQRGQPRHGTAEEAGGGEQGGELVRLCLVYEVALLAVSHVAAPVSQILAQEEVLPPDATSLASQARQMRQMRGLGSQHARAGRVEKYEGLGETRRTRAYSTPAASTHEGGVRWRETQPRQMACRLRHLARPSPPGTLRLRASEAPGLARGIGPLLEAEAHVVAHHARC